MGWRTVVITKSSKIDLRFGYMVLRDTESTVRIHIPEISVLIIESTACSVTTALLCELIKEKITVIFCDEKANPHSELNALYGSHDCSSKVRSQIQWTPSAKELVWTSIVGQKIKNQAAVLGLLNKPECEMLYGYLNELEPNDATNREGHSAKVYFNALFGKGFSRSDESPVNAALNYGYGILLACFNREVIANGYITQIGLFHDNIFNKYNLACDIMEPFRPIIDKYVVLHIPEKFEKDEKHALLSLLSDEILIDGRKQTLLNAIKIYTKSVLDAIEEADISGIKYYLNEL